MEYINYEIWVQHKTRDYIRDTFCFYKMICRRKLREIFREYYHKKYLKEIEELKQEVYNLKIKLDAINKST